MLSMPVGFEGPSLSGRLTRRQLLHMGGLSMLGLGLPSALSELVPIAISESGLRLARVGEESAFHQDSRNGCSAQDKIAPATNAAVCRRRAADHSGMNTGGQGRAFRAVKVCLDPVSSAP